jgi:hypothetical protein
LAGTTDAASLLNIPTNVLSRLVPHIEIYKIYYDLAKDGTGKQTLLSENGCAISLPFSNNYSPRIANDILKNRASQGEGIGLKSVNVKFLGTNPAEVKTMLEVNLKIFARDFAELIKARNVKKSASGEGYVAAFSDLITRDPSRKYENNRTYRDEVFRIRMVVGWSVPEGASESIFRGVKDKKQILSTLNQTKMIITCALASHQLSFGQDGSLELDVKYIGRLETELRNNRKSIFNYQARIETDTKAAVEKARKALREAKEVKEKQGWFDDAKDVALEGLKLNQKLEDYKWGLFGFDGSPIHPDLVGSDVAEAERQLEFQINQAQQLKAEELGRAYKQFLNGFFQEKKHSIFWAEIPPHIYRQSIDPRVPRPEFGGATVLVERMGNPPLGSGHDPTRVDSGAAAEAKNEEVVVYQLHAQTGAMKHKRGDVWASNVSGGDGKMKKAVDDAFALISDDEGGSYEDAINKLNQDLSDIADDRYENDEDGDKVPSPEGGTEKYNLYFTYLGDLIDYSMNTVKDPNINQSAENLKMVMGAFTYVDPMTYETTRVNITDIPVSLTSFLNWMFQRYVRKERTDVTAFDFLKDITQDLGVKYLGGTCFSAGSVPATRTRFGSNMTLTVPRYKGKTLLPEQGGKNGISNKQLAKISLIKQDPSVQNYPPEDMDHVCYIYVTNTLPEDKNGKEMEDSRHGIFHFRLGADRGLLKKANYKRMDQPYLQEARIIENDKIDDSPQDPNSRSPNGVLRLKEVYNCDIEMYGNTVFYPGMVFYIDPSKMGFDGGAPYKRLLAENLGVKGYYHVNKVEHIFESGKYETLLEGIFLTDGNNDFYKKRTKKQIGKLNRMMKYLTSPSSDAAKKFVDAYVLQDPQTGQANHMQASSEELSAIEKEFNEEMEM